MDESINNIQYRSAQFDVESIGDATESGERSLTISFSSEFPVMTARGWEILAHDSDNADFGFIGSSRAPLCLEHNREVQIGVIDTASIEKGRGVASIRFSRSQLGQEIFQDVQDGIRTNISVGYRYLDKGTLVGKRDGINVYQYRWQPYEISVVSVPADPTIGIGRSFNYDIIPEESQIITNMEERNMDDNLKIDAIEADEASRAEHTEELVLRGAPVDQIEKLCRHYKFDSEIDGLVAREATLQEAKDHITTLWAERAKETKMGQAPAVHTRKQEEYSIGKALRAATTGDWAQAGFEREHCQELARDSQRAWDNNVVFLDPNAATRATALTPANSAQGTGFGKELVSSTYMPERLIDALWNQTYLNKVGTDSMLGLTGNASFPVITSNMIASFVTETQDIGAPQAIATQVKSISPKELVAKGAYSRQALLQNQPNIEAKIVQQIFQAIAQKLDAVALSNSGVVLSTTGLLNEAIAVVSAGNNGAVPNLATLVALESALINNKVDPAGGAYVGSSKLLQALKTTLKDSANTASNYIISDTNGAHVNGYPIFGSQNIPSNLTKGVGTNLSAAIFGKWDDLLVAQWGSIALEVDRYTAADTSQIVIRSYSFWDMIVKRVESFAVVKDYIA